MSEFEVPNPILNPPFDEPAHHWYIEEGDAAEMRAGRRPSVVFPPRTKPSLGISLTAHLLPPPSIQAATTSSSSTAFANGWIMEEPKLPRRDADDAPPSRMVAPGREAGAPLLPRSLRLPRRSSSLGKHEADFLQGLAVPREELSKDKEAEGNKAFPRLGCKMATGSGQDYRDGNACRMEHPQQSPQPGRCSFLRRHSRGLP